MGAPLGISGRIARSFLTSEITPLLALVGFLLGLFAVMITPREEEPQINVTFANVFIAFPGASAKEVEELVSIPAEQILSELEGLKHVYSVSRPGMSVLTVQFEVGEDRTQAIVRLYNAIYSNQDWLPPGLGVAQPIIKPKGIDDVPIVALTLWSQDQKRGAHELLQVAHAMEVELKRVKGTRDIYTLGGPEQIVHVLLDVDALRAYNLALSDLRFALQQSNATRPSGNLVNHNQEVEVQAGQFLSTAGEVGDLIVAVHNGRPVYLRDVAKIRRGPEQPKEYAWFGTGPLAGQKGIHARGEFPAVTIAIAKQPGSNAVDIAKQITERVEQLKGIAIPEGVNVTMTRNYGVTADAKAKQLIGKLIFATTFVVLLVMVALGKREAFIVGVAVVVTLAMTLFASWAWGFTLNRVSLFALIFSIGILVDDAIVVVENIHRHMQLGDKTLLEAIPGAVDEVGGPTILATLTVIAALLPMAFVTGLMGPYMSPIPINASIGMLISLAVAFIVTPWLANKVLHHDHATTASSTDKPKRFGRFELYYQQKIRPVLDGLKNRLAGYQKAHPRLDTFVVRIKGYVKSGKQLTAGEEGLLPLFEKVVGPFLAGEEGRKRRHKLILFVVGLIVISVGLVVVKLVVLKMLPFDNKSEFQVVVDMPEGTTLEQTTRVLEELGRYLSTVPEVTDYQVYAGGAAPINFNGLVRQYYLRRGANVGDIQINLVDKHKRHRKSHEIALSVRKPLQEIGRRFNANVKVVEVPPGPPVMSPLVAEVYGANYAGQLKVAKEIRSVFEKTADIVDVDDSLEADSAKLILRIDQQKAALLGVSPQSAVNAVSTALSGEDVSYLHPGNLKYPMPIRLEYPIANKARIDDVLRLYLRSQSGQLVPLGDIVKGIKTHREQAIYHKDMLPVVFVTGDMAGKLDSPLYGMFDIYGTLEDTPVAHDRPVSQFLISQPDNPYEYSLKWDGEWQITYETFRDMGIAYGIGLIMIYLLVVAQFRSYIVPIVIMAPIPLTIIGVLPGHALFGAQFTATSMIGMIALAGIIVRNSILLVDFINQQLEEGMSFEKAVIRSGAVRAKPIVLTGLAAMLGALFILDDPIFNGLALTLIFGILVSTILTLVLIPVMYYAVMQKRKGLGS